MADPSSSTPFQSSSATPIPENMSSSQAAQAPQAPAVTDESTTPTSSPSIETLFDRQALFDSSTDRWIRVPPGLILMPVFEDTSAHTATDNTHLGWRTDGGTSAEQEYSNGGIHTEEHLDGSLSDNGYTGNIEGPRNILHSVQQPLSPNWMILRYRIQKVYKALRKLALSLNPPFEIDDQGCPIAWDPINVPLPDFDPNEPLPDVHLNFDDMLDGTFVQNQTGHDSTLYHEAPQTSDGNPSLVIEINMFDEPVGNGYAHNNEDADTDVD